MWNVLFVLLTIAVLAVTALPMTNLRHWSVRGHDFPRLQYAALAFVLLLALALWPFDAFRPSPLWALVLVPVLLYQLHWIRPYNEAHATEVASATPAERDALPALRILTSNVLMTNRDSARLIELVRSLRPDLLVTLESDARWQRELDAALGDWPHRVACPLDNLYGMHLYSRLPLDEARIDFLVDDDIPSIAARLRVGGLPVRFHAIHPTPPAPGENPRSTERDVELLALADALEGSEERIVVTGDLNDVAWSRSTQLFRRVSGLLDPRIGRGTFNTYHADWPMLRWPLDHVFLSGQFLLAEMRRLPHIGSDHFPVLVDLRLRRDASPDSEQLEVTPDLGLEADTRASDVASQAAAPSLAAAPVADATA